MKPKIKAKAAEMAVLFRDGETLESIGQKFGCTREYVRQCITALGVKREDGGVAVTAQRKEQSRKDALDARSLRHRGMTVDEFRALPTKVRDAYRYQKRNAAFRGIEWNLNLAQWWEIWHLSGKWEKRGRGHGYCMARKGDTGPYSPDNVYICTCAQNTSDSYEFKPWHERKGRVAQAA